MANQWNIPQEVEGFVKSRDKQCVYCKSEFTDAKESKKGMKTWEHVINDLDLTGRDNIVLSCMSCNSSKGAKQILDWFESSYCKKNGINKDSVSDVVRKVVLKEEKLSLTETKANRPFCVNLKPNASNE